MDRRMLDQYIDACELIRETEEEILNLESMQMRVVQDSVRGSNPEYPYEQRRFKIEGVELQYIDSIRLEKMRPDILTQLRSVFSENRSEEGL